MKPNKATVKKLRKLQTYIMDEPRRFHMDIWGESVKDIKAFKKLVKGRYTEYASDQHGVPIRCSEVCNLAPPCGTVGCLAGNACVIAKLIKPAFADGVEVFAFSGETFELAQNWLGVNDDDARKLFYLPKHGQQASCWPLAFAKKYEKAKTPRGKAKVACARIDHYIETGE